MAVARSRPGRGTQGLPHPGDRRTLRRPSLCYGFPGRSSPARWRAEDDATLLSRRGESGNQQLAQAVRVLAALAGQDQATLFEVTVIPTRILQPAEVQFDDLPAFFAPGPQSNWP